jgi:hypothetical protein
MLLVTGLIITIVAATGGFGSSGDKDGDAKAAAASTDSTDPGGDDNKANFGTFMRMLNSEPDFAMFIKNDKQEKRYAAFKKMWEDKNYGGGRLVGPLKVPKYDENGRFADGFRDVRTPLENLVMI